MMSDTPLFDLLTAHPTGSVVIGAVCLFVSLCLIARLWLRHAKDSLLRKLFWSVVLLIPLIGWIFYGGFYHPPGYSSVPSSTEHSAHISGYGEGGHF
jgi:hypothetical protein